MKQAKDRQKKKSGAKGIRIDAEGAASFEDFANAESQDYDFEPQDPEKTKSSSKKVIISLWLIQLDMTTEFRNH